MTNVRRIVFFFFQAEDGIRDIGVTGVQTCALPIYEMFPIGFDRKRNIAAEYHMSFGDLDGTFEKCHCVLEDTFYTQAQAHMATETHSSFAYVDFYGRLTVVSSTQTPFHMRRIIGAALGIPISEIRVIKPRVGGGYGGKQQIHGEFLVSLVALRTGKPAKLIYTRKEVFQSTFCRHAMKFNKIGRECRSRWSPYH